MLSVAIQNDDLQKRKRSAGLLHLMAGFFLLFKSVDFFRYAEALLPVVLPLIGSGTSIIYGLRGKKIDPRLKYSPYLRLMQVFLFLALGIFFLRLDRNTDVYMCVAFAAIAGLLFIAERNITRPSAIEFSETGLQIPGIGRMHHIAWTELENVVIREDFITLFHVRQKFLQFAVAEILESQKLADVQLFCETHLATNRHNMPANAIHS